MTKSRHCEKRSPFDKRSGEAIHVTGEMDCFAYGSQ
jgi:hypothetical protein